MRTRLRPHAANGDSSGHQKVGREPERARQRAAAARASYPQRAVAADAPAPRRQIASAAAGRLRAGVGRMSEAMKHVRCGPRRSDVRAGARLGGPPAARWRAAPRAERAGLAQAPVWRRPARRASEGC